MLSGLSRTVALYFRDAGSIKTDDEVDVFAYFVEMAIADLFTFGAMLAAAVVSGRVVESLLCLGGFMPLRIFGGGFHETTHLRCFLLSMLVFGGNILLSLQITPSAAFVSAAVMTGFSAAAVLAAAPIRNDNNPIPEDRLSANGRRAKAASVIFVFLTVLMLFKHMYIYAFCFGFGQAAAGAFLLWEKITKFEGRKTL